LKDAVNNLKQKWLKNNDRDRDRDRDINATASQLGLPMQALVN